MASARATKRFMKLAFTPLAIFSLVLVVPFATGFYYTFTDWDGFESTKLVGFDNHKNLLSKNDIYKDLFSAWDLVN